jgi:hypothetical protein
MGLSLLAATEMFTLVMRPLSIWWLTETLVPKNLDRILAENLHIGKYAGQNNHFMNSEFTTPGSKQKTHPQCYGCKVKYK